MTSIDIELARMLGMPVVGKAKLIPPTGIAVETSKVRMDLFRVGTQDVADLVVTTRDFREFARAHRRGIGGILGNDVLGRYVLHIDFANRRLEFRKSRKKLKGHVADINFELQKGLPLASCRLSGGITAPVIIDTGAEGNIEFYPDVGTKLILRGPVVLRSRSDGEKKYEVSIGQIDFVQCGNLRISPLQVEVSSSTAPNRFSGPFRPGLLGNGILERYTIEFDFPSSTLRLYRPNN